MNCSDVRDKLPLAFYGELSFEDEDRVEQHLADCAECRAERALLERLGETLELARPVPPAGLLARCRRELSTQLKEEAAPGASAWWRRLLAAAIDPVFWLKPAGAVALVALGFFAARWDAPPPPQQIAGQVSHEGVPAARVRWVSPDPAGGVQLTIDEVRQRQLSGVPSDDTIRHLLLAAAADPTDPALRLESIEALKPHSSDVEVRSALLAALQRDSNSGVRLKALEALRPYAKDGATRRVLAHVLLHDQEPSIRVQAIDLLVQSKDAALAGFLQDLLRRENNTYIRSRSQRALAEMNASVGTF